MDYTLSAAAKAAGLGKSTLHRAIKSGRLSARRLEDGTYRIDPAELARAFPPEPSGPSPWDISARNGTGGNTPPSPQDHAAQLLQLEVTMLRDALERERETVGDLRRRLDRAEERVLQLSAPPQAPAPREDPALPAPATSSRRGLLARLLGR